MLRAKSHAQTIVARALMQAMQLTQPRTPLALVSLPDPAPGPDEVRVRVAACGVCRTDLHVVVGSFQTQGCR
jgi:D-arabinose 1-dehydrogenase-like Zn-dependent alcohol dehydrogenase